jgi:hypothetical protein
MRTRMKINGSFMGEPIQLVFSSVPQAQRWWKLNGSWFEFDPETPMRYQTEMVVSD